MKIFRVELTRKRLESMPQEERTAVLLLGHACNELGVLLKLLLVSIPKQSPPNKIADHVQAGQTLILLRILVGKVHEAWRLFGKRGQPLRSKYVSLLSDEAKAALDALNKHFGSDGRLATIRNKLAFHYTDDDNLIEKHWQTIPEADPWNFYLSGPNFNSFYYASELVITGVTTQLAMPESARALSGHLSQEEAGFKAYFDLINTVSGQIIRLFGDFIAAIITTTLPDVVAEEVEIGDAAKFSRLELPFFWDEADMKATKRKAEEITSGKKTGG